MDEKATICCGGGGDGEAFVNYILNIQVKRLSSIVLKSLLLNLVTEFNS